MIPKYVLPFLAAAGLTFAVYTVIQARKPLPPVKPLTSPPTRPEGSNVPMIAGAGLIEAQTENIPIGTTVPGVVEEIFVNVGHTVKTGDPLFRLDDRSLQATLTMNQAELAAAQALLHRLESAPRAEDVPPARAAVEQAKALLYDAQVAMNRSGQLVERRVGPPSDFDKDRFSYLAAKAALEKAEADLAKILAGSWAEDIEVARASVSEAQAKIQATKIELDRLTVRALVDGKVLQVNVHPGQFAAMNWREPMIVLGNVDQLNVRVDIDENDLPRFLAGAPAFATLRGRPQDRFELRFVRVEPYVIPKKSLTGDNSERVDTRVLQVLYALPDRRTIPVFVGQQVDVYLKAAPASSSTPPPDSGPERSPGLGPAPAPKS